MPKYGILDTTELEKEMHKLKQQRQPIKAYLKEFVFLMVEGSKEVYRDTKWIIDLKKKKYRSHYTGFQLREADRITLDLLKFLPFSFFLVVPFAELLLPPYLLLFPNSIPSQYTFDHKWDEYIQSLEEKQEKGHEVLVQKLKNYLVKKGAIPEVFNNEDSYKAAFFKYHDDMDKEIHF